MQPVYIHKRALWGGDDVHNAGSDQLVCLSSQIKWTAHSVRATLWDRWEDLCQPVPGEERGSMKPIESYIILVAARPINCFHEFWISQILARLTQMGLGLHVEENALVHLMVTFIQSLYRYKREKISYIIILGVGWGVDPLILYTTNNKYKRRYRCSEWSDIDIINEINHDFLQPMCAASRGILMVTQSAGLDNLCI